MSDSNNTTSDDSVRVADSYNDNSRVDNSDNSYLTGAAKSSNMFGDSALVASATLSSYVTGVSVRYNGSGGDTPSSIENNISNDGSSFQNFAGMQALNQNTGVGASQNANVSVAVSTGDVSF